MSLACALTRDWTHKLGVSGQFSNRLSSLARARLPSHPHWFAYWTAVHFESALPEQQLNGQGGPVSRHLEQGSEHRGCGLQMPNTGCAEAANLKQVWVCLHLSSRWCPSVSQVRWVHKEVGRGVSGQTDECAHRQEIRKWPGCLWDLVGRARIENDWVSLITGDRLVLAHHVQKLKCKCCCCCFNLPNGLFGRGRYIVLYILTHVNSYSHHHDQDTEQFHHPSKPLRPQPLPEKHPFTPNLWHPLNYFLSLLSYLFKNAVSMESGIAQHISKSIPSCWVY